MNMTVIKLVLGLTGMAIVLGLFQPEASAASLRELLDKQSELRRQAEDSRKQVEQKKREAANLQQAIGELNEDINDTQNQLFNTEEQISVTNNLLNELSSQIAGQQLKLDEYNQRLRTAYITLYELSRTSPLEVLIASRSLSEVVSYGQYVQAIGSQLQSQITDLNSLLDDLNAKKTESEKQKAGLAELNQQLEDTKAALGSRRAQKDYLLGATQGEQAKYESLLGQLQAEQETLGQEIYEARKLLSFGEQILIGGSNYPWDGEPNPSAVDPWLFYKRQCTSYAAWKFQAHFGRVFYNTRPGQGSAWNWPALAADQGYRTSSEPRANAVVSWPIGPSRPYGHVAWVTSVNDDQTINITEYNWVLRRGYSERRGVDPFRYGTPTYMYP